MNSRNEPLTSRINVPGPGTYDAKDEKLSYAKRNPSHTFGLRLDKSGYFNISTPGPVDYDPNIDPVKKHSPSIKVGTE